MKKLASYQNWPVHSVGLEDLYQRLNQGTVPHAMLLLGHPGAAREISKYLAKLLLCTADEVPCGRCAACLAVEQGNHPDVHVVDGLQSGSVKTAEIESLQGQLSLRAHGGGRLVYVIYGIDTATPAAANRLLKTLEEPNSPVVALLTAVHARRVLPTILSRCSQYALQSEKLWEDPDSPGLEGLGQADGEETFAAQVTPMIQWTETCLSRKVPAVRLADQFMKAAGSIPLGDALHFLSLWLRDIIYVQTGQLEHIRFEAFQRELHKHAQLASTAQLAAMIERVLDAKLRVQSHAAPLLNLEQMCIRVQRGLANV
ncbi:hypothetical protein JI721_07305 [Alicyclobacillus cycloheptanicus]|uniref:DNA polymerase-3 subunit delta n=1 Tax=Alicyclobacillus cycloheptanicus TaxID=1457 RepID=A0ABT9XIS6_9BACL|nr:DNA polymerase III subunit delta' C-terminal domain-containing protein [Alicyclobacillus cycloheptanicus]MDQ0190183.1 DNA polymerase-3 subunit delta' [Alicyclobacillus cycloheptanicus]WDM02565.1 hypothetical protein JI721_07305 [Alicyclobacillus cycloheptanicus]